MQTPHHTTPHHDTIQRARSHKWRIVGIECNTFVWQKQDQLWVLQKEFLWQSQEENSNSLPFQYMWWARCYTPPNSKWEQKMRKKEEGEGRRRRGRGSSTDEFCQDVRLSHGKRVKYRIFTHNIKSTMQRTRMKIIWTHLLSSELSPLFSKECPWRPLSEVTMVNLSNRNFKKPTFNDL